MECRIQTTREGNRRLVLVAGRLSIQELPDFLGACAHAAGEQLVIDLSDLVSIDEETSRHVVRLAAEGARLQAVSPYIQMVLGFTTGTRP